MFDSKTADRALNIFYEISRIPRMSGGEQALTDYLVSFAGRLGFSVTRDSRLNVLIKKGRGASVILQAHTDMVCEKNSGSRHDFRTDPIIPYIDGDWLKAKDTTLGADNGAGVAVILALLENPSVRALEALFTADEEDGLTGSKYFDVSALTGKIFINLDSEEDDTLIAGCAAGAEVDIHVPIQKQACNAQVYRVSISGLTGGHSGMDIDKGRQNAIILMARLLRALRFDFSLVSLDGGIRRNAIPRECEAVFAADSSGVKAHIANIADSLGSIGEQGLVIRCDKAAGVSEALTAVSANTVLDIVLRAPNGVLERGRGVSVSCNLGACKTNGDTVTLSFMPRADTNPALERLNKELALLCAGARAQARLANPAWVYREHSPLREKMKELYREMYNRNLKVDTVHAGLECAVFADKLPDTEFVSAGPLILDAHSPSERMSLSSFDRVCGFLERFLDKKTEVI